MPYAIIDTLIVINIAVADPEYAQSQGWVECPDNVQAGWTYVDGVFSPPAPDPDALKAANKAQASALLSATDWVTLPDVSDAANNPYLTNVSDFYVYRNTLRSIAVDPPEVVDSWPIKPQEVWSS